MLGTATARELAAGGLSVLVLEAEPGLAAHQSGRNSGVIHSGLYYKPGSLKARLCVTGREQLYRYCSEKGIPHARCGKLVVATRESDLPRLAELEARGRANGLTGVRRLDAAGLRDQEPHAAGLAALLVPETGIVDFSRVVQAYAEDIGARGGTIRTSARVTAVVPDGSRLTIETTAGSFASRYLVNCAGLQADRLARLCGAEPELRIVPFRGEYFELVPERADLVRGLIYPVPDPAFPFLGVHLTRTVYGKVEAGPNAVLALDRHGYRRPAFSARDTWETLSYFGFWRLAVRHWRSGMAEVWRSARKSIFARDLRHLVPEIRADDLVRGGCGIRAQALNPDGSLVDDFRIVGSERAVHILNAPSPGATASLAIGSEIARMAAHEFGLDARRRA